MREVRQRAEADVISAMDSLGCQGILQNAF